MSDVQVGDSAANGYRLVGIPDGLGAFDNGDGTITLLVNHELGSTKGVVRSHGSKGAFVSKWITGSPPHGATRTDRPRTGTCRHLIRTARLGPKPHRGGFATPLATLEVTLTWTSPTGSGSTSTPIPP